MNDIDHVVWVSRAPIVSILIKGFLSDVFLADEARAIDAMERNRTGEALPPERFPTEHYVKDPGQKIRKLPDLALAGGFWTVSAGVANVLRAFDLGRSSLYPTKAFRYDRKTPLEGEYFCLNLGEQKSAFLPEHSPRARDPYLRPQGIWRLSLVPKDGDMAVDQTALAGPDLWVDPRVRHAFFLSDRLAQGVTETKLARRFGLFRCRVV
jgi:hypothetical protein